MIPYRGEILSIISAVAWAAAVILFRISGRRVNPLALNLFKSTIAALLLLATAWLASPARSLEDWRTMSILVLSGLFGIALSDTLFFVCLNKLGASLTAIIECLYSPFVIILSLFFLGEVMKLRQIGGVILILAAVMVITWRRDEKRSSGKLTTGIIAGILSMFFMAAGIVMVKPLLTDVPILWTAAVRMSGGAFFLVLAGLFHPSRWTVFQPLRARENWAVMSAASLIGAYGGIIAWVAGMKWTAASIAAPLNQLSTIFIFIFAVIFLKEKLTPGRLIALLMAFAGAILASWA